MNASTALLVGVLLGVGAGLGLGVTLGRAWGRAEARAPSFREPEALDGAADRQRRAVETLVEPLASALGRVEGQLRELERDRVGAYSALTEQVAAAHATSERVRSETASLVTALRAPQARGRWGELQLHRVVELAGMAEHCDFDEQVEVCSPDGRLRPDLVVRLTGRRSVVVDAKVALSAYLEAVEAVDEAHREQRLRAHARHLREHVDRLAAKQYWRALPTAPEFVVLFIPGEAFLAPALERDVGLLEHAMAARVLIATPSTLVAMLRTVAWSWQQDSLTSHAREVFDLGRELYTRLGTVGEHVGRLGRSVNRVVEDYNAAVGSLEGRLLVSARRMRDLGVVDGDLPGPAQVHTTARPVTGSELTETDSEDPAADDPTAADDPAGEATRLRSL